MALVVIGVLLLALKLAGLGPVADWGWPWILAPFGLAAAWWAFADGTGFTQRRAIEKMQERKVARRERDMKALGLDVRADRRIRVLRESGSRAAASDEEAAKLAPSTPRAKAGGPGDPPGTPPPG